MHDRPLRILTWHVHGNYLWYLTRLGHEWYLPVRPGRPEGYGGRGLTFTWSDNVHEVDVDDVPGLGVDVVLFQSHRNWLVDQHEILSPAQRRLPRVYLEHDPPRESPTDTTHPVEDPEVLIVHVTHFNDLMWDCRPNATRVVEHGVAVPDDARYTGELERGVVVVNNLARRRRRLGADIFQRVREHVPLDLVGMGSEELGGLGEVPPPELAGFTARYRFFFHPIRWTSLGLAVCEAMTVGLPVVAVAATEIPTVIESGVSGWTSTDVGRLTAHMRALLDDPVEARRLGDGARRAAVERFNIDRFMRDWDETLRTAAGAPPVN